MTQEELVTLIKESVRSILSESDVPATPIQEDDNGKVDGIQLADLMSAWLKSNGFSDVMLEVNRKQSGQNINYGKVDCYAEVHYNNPAVIECLLYDRNEDNLKVSTAGLVEQFNQFDTKGSELAPKQQEYGNLFFTRVTFHIESDKEDNSLKESFKYKAGLLI